MSIDMSQVNALAVDLSGAGERVKPLVQVATVKAGTDIVADSKILAPVDTGNLAGSIGMDLDSDRLGVTCGPTAEYGEYVERGTSKMAAQPYMAPSFDRNAPLWERAVQAAGAEAI